MLGLLGLFGALIGSFVADGLLTATPKSDAETGDTDGAEDNAHQNASGSDSDETVDLLDIASAAQQVDATSFSDSSAPNESESSDISVSPPENTRITGTASDDILASDAGSDTLDGGDGDDLLDGRDGDDLMFGGEGEDYLNAGGGDDTVIGGADDDVAQGEDGNDLMQGGTGNDSLAGHMDDDDLDGGEGDDTLLGGSGDDSLNGGEGDDWLAGGFGDDLLHGGAGSDTLDGNNGNDTIWGFDTEDTRAEDVDFLNGGAGDDHLYLGAGDYANGGAGADIFTIGDWLSEGEFARITDYDPDEDDIVVLYDAMAHPNPTIELLTEEESDDATVLLDGIPLAVIANGAGLSLNALTLLPSDSL